MRRFRMISGIHLTTYFCACAAQFVFLHSNALPQFCCGGYPFPDYFPWWCGVIAGIVSIPGVLLGALIAHLTHLFDAFPTSPVLMLGYFLLVQCVFNSILLKLLGAPFLRSTDTY
jgi:hypothetical protein